MHSHVTHHTFKQQVTETNLDSSSKLCPPPNSNTPILSNSMYTPCSKRMNKYSTYPHKVHISWRSRTKSTSGDVVAPRPSPDGVSRQKRHIRTHSVPSARNYRARSHRAASPPRGGAGEPRLRPADTKNAKPGLRNHARGLRSSEALRKRRDHRKDMKKHSRRLVRALRSIGYSIPRAGQEADILTRKQLLELRNTYVHTQVNTILHTDTISDTPFERITFQHNAPIRIKDINDLHIDSVAKNSKSQNREFQIAQQTPNIISFKHINNFIITELNVRGG